MRSALRRLDWLIARPIAHRGLHDARSGIIENTKSAFTAAIAGNYAIECDLQMSADEEAMVFHDETLDRLMAATGPVKARKSADLKSIAFKGGDDRMQTLDELLDQVRGQVPLVIELKSDWHDDGRLARRAVEVLADYDGSFALMSFDPDVVETVRRLAPSFARGIVADKTDDTYYDFLPLNKQLELRFFLHFDRTRPDFISYHWADLPFPAVSQFRDSGRPVICWTVRCGADAAKARRYADQITFEGFAA